MTTTSRTDRCFQAKGKCMPLSVSRGARARPWARRAEGGSSACAAPDAIASARHARRSFKGKIVHPQHWGPEDDLSYPGQRIAVIGSGATAITMLPNLVQGGAAHVTMVQRTPTYIFAGEEHDKLAVLLSKFLPESVTHSIMRWKNVSARTAPTEQLECTRLE